jgi:hypothetical protein
MVQLSYEQVATIAGRVEKDVSNEQLRNDLLDHYCCYIEEQMENGSDFEVAYNNAFVAITPNGMHEIQEELFFLLTFKKQTNMKRIIYGFGFFAAFFISTGLMFKVMHWPGATVMTVVGFAMLIITVVALLVNATKYMGALPVVHKLRFMTGLVSALLISAGSIFKALHYPTANMQIVLGMVLLNFVFMPLFFFQLYKKAIALK